MSLRQRRLPTANGSHNGYNDEEGGGSRHNMNGYSNKSVGRSGLTLTPPSLLVLVIVVFFVGFKVGSISERSNANVKLGDMERFFLRISNMEKFYDSDGPPPNLMVVGKRDHYTPVPPESRRLFYTEKKGATTITRAFRHEGWTLVDEHDILKAHVFYRARGHKPDTKLNPWQRFSRVKGSDNWEAKDGFFNGFKEYSKKHPEHDLYFLPETYCLEDEQQQQEFTKRLEEGGGKSEPWLLKKVSVNNGQGIEVIGPHSKALDTAVARSIKDKGNRYIIQNYICDELTWFNGNKFDLRMYWVVASVDPPIVLYHDGYVRVGGSAYNETDFSNTANHLTNHAFRTSETTDVTADDLYRRIRDHYSQNYDRLSSRITDPVQHVRSQMKEAIGTLYAAFKDVFPPKDYIKYYGTENIFGFYGCDFVIDNDLNVHFLEAQASPGFGESYDYRVELFRDLYRPIPGIVEEIALKQQENANANILPLQTLQGYEIVYAGNWQYKYKNYQKPTTKKPCVVQTA